MVSCLGSPHLGMRTAKAAVPIRACTYSVVVHIVDVLSRTHVTEVDVSKTITNIGKCLVYFFINVI